MVDIPATSLALSGEKTSPIERLNISEPSDLTPQQEIEKLLWTEMLKHSGLEKAFTPSGGEAASAFARYIVEAIAEDITRSHPLGLDVYQSASETVFQGDQNV